MTNHRKCWTAVLCMAVLIIPFQFHSRPQQDSAAQIDALLKQANEQMYVTSLNSFKQGASDCMAAITQHSEGVEDTVTNVNHTVLNQAVSEFDLGVRNLYIATEVMRKL